MATSEKIKNFVKPCPEQPLSKAWSKCQYHIPAKHFLLKALSNC